MDHYYQHEEDTETPETQLDTLRAQEGDQQAVTLWSQETLANARTQAEVIRNDAAERGDVATQTGVVEIFKAAEYLQQTLEVTNNTLNSLAEAYKVNIKQKQAIESQLEDITEAIYDEDTEHPLLMGLAQSIENRTFEMIADEEYEIALIDARSEVWDEVSVALKRLVPKSEWVAIYSFVTALNGDLPFNDIQRGLLISLIQTFAVQAATS